MNYYHSIITIKLLVVHQGIYFFGDYDLNSLLNYKGKNLETTIYKNFKKIFDFVGKNTDIYITDFKLGEDSSGEALRWTMKEMKKNNNKGYTFEEALLQKSTIKWI